MGQWRPPRNSSPAAKARAMADIRKIYPTPKPQNPNAFNARAKINQTPSVSCDTAPVSVREALVRTKPNAIGTRFERDAMEAP